MSRRLLFVLASPEYLRYFDTTLTQLAERGHEVAVGVNWLRERKHARLDELIGDRRIEILGQIPARGDVWRQTARAVRGSFDFIRYLHPSLAGATALRERTRRKAAPAPVRLLDRIPSLAPDRLERYYRVLRFAESAIPVSPVLVDFLRARRPDLVVVSPLVDLVSEQVDLIRAAHALGIPVALAVASWDNLTNKGHLRVLPDAVTVWNARQRDEAVALHGVPPERIAITGAQLFDRWFDRQPSRTRDEFCAAVGLPVDRPIVLYTASSIFIARSELEVPFVRKWLTALRENGAPELRSASVLIRPHPFNSVAWETADLSDLGPVAIWPRARYTPASESSRDGFFDSLYYSAAVVGINTSAMIEAAVLNKPVLSLMTGDFAGTQEGTLHFHHLLPENGGFLRVASTLEQHAGQLVDLLRQPEAARRELERFVHAFVRPQGLEQPSTPRLCDALERAAELHPTPATDPWSARMARVALWPFACLLAIVMPAIDADGRRGDVWWKKIEPITTRLLKRFVIRPWRFLRRAVVWVARLIVRRAHRSYRWLRTVPARVLRLLRHARYHLAVRVRAVLSPSDGSDRSQ